MMVEGAGSRGTKQQLRAQLSSCKQVAEKNLKPHLLSDILPLGRSHPSYPNSHQLGSKYSNAYLFRNISPHHP